MKCFLTTSLGWIAFIAIAYSYMVTTQELIIPNQRGYMEVRHNDIKLTPSNFEADIEKQDKIGQLINQLNRK
ncbi:MAG: hypothetical protein ACKO96_05005 [Flammeovirgaceae bacterium]